VTLEVEEIMRRIRKAEKGLPKEPLYRPGESEKRRREGEASLKDIMLRKERTNIV